jgi:type III secretion protein V
MLSRESQFYGSMDGAMKFVKGDVIASLVIIVVNLVGGLAIGVGQRGMEVVDALKRYGLLTIGDGLVSQIPALVLSTAAGVLVTRTASEEPDTPLGEELARQIFGIPKAMRVAAGFVAGLAIVPGLPAVPFLVLAVALWWAARARSKSMAREAQHAATEPAPKVDGGSAGAARRGPQFVPIVVPWGVEVAEDLEAMLEDAPDRDEGLREGLRARIIGLRQTLFAELGVPLPPPRVRVNPSLPARHAMISLFEVPARIVTVSTTDTTGERVAQEALDVLRARAADFLGIAETQRLLDELEQIAPAIVRNVVPKPVTLATLADVLRRLLDEGIGVRDLRAILEALATIAATEKDPLHLSEYVRGQLRRAITFRLTRGAGQLGVYLLDPTIEDTVRRAVTRTPNGAFLTLPPAMARDVVASIRRALGEASPGEGAPTVLLTQPDIRRFVRKLIEVDFPAAQVVSFAELLPEVALRPLARANLLGMG